MRLGGGAGVRALPARASQSTMDKPSLGIDRTGATVEIRTSA